MNSERSVTSDLPSFSDDPCSKSKTIVKLQIKVDVKLELSKDMDFAKRRSYHGKGLRGIMLDTKMVQN